MSRNSTDSEVTTSLRADRLRAIRERKGLSQRELGKLCGVGMNQITRYENEMAEPSSSALLRIARALDISSDYLLGLSDSPQNVSLQELPPEKRKLLDAFELGDGVAMLEIVTERLRDLRGEKSAGDE